MLGSGSRSADKVAPPLWRRLSSAVLAVLGAPEATADLSFEETTAALQVLARLAVHPLAADALLNSGVMEVSHRPAQARRAAPHRAAPRRTAPHRTLQVLLERLVDRSSSALHRTAAVTALTALLHQPRGMALFVDIPGGAAGATPAAAGDDAAAAPQSGYQRVLRALAAPLPGPMQQPVRAVCSLVALWDVAVQLRDACQQARRTRTHHTHAPHAHRRAPPAPSARGLFAPWPRPDRASACSRRRRVCVPTRRPCSPVTRPPPPCSRPSARWGAS